MIDALKVTLSTVSLFAGLLFFVAGTVGLLRFPDIFSRLHAVTKADTVGLGLMALGLILRTSNPRDAVMMALIWVLAMASGAVSCQLYARFERERDSQAAAGEAGTESSSWRKEQR